MQPIPTVSVLIPTYNYAHILDETIESVLNQTYTNFELIIVDDQSKDNTDEVVQKYLNDKRVSYYKNSTNLGVVSNWNKCLSYAKGQYIKFLMADDKFHPRLLERFITIMEQYPMVSLVTCFKKEFGRRSNTLALPLENLQHGKKVIYHTLFNYGWLGEPSAVMFRAVDLKVGNFNANFIWLQDWEMWLRLLTLGDCYIIPEPLVYIRNHSGQMTKKVMKSYINYFEEYTLYKEIKQTNKYHIDLSEVQIDKLIKKKAVKCAMAMYKVMPSLYKKESRIVFIKALRIAASEKVLMSPLLRLFKREQQKRLIRVVETATPM